MLKLKELLELDGMKYSDTIKEKHKKRMKREMVYLNNPIIPHNPPPANSSRETLKELHWFPRQEKDFRSIQKLVMECQSILPAKMKIN